MKNKIKVVDNYTTLTGENYVIKIKFDYIDDVRKKKMISFWQSRGYEMGYFSVNEYVGKKKSFFGIYTGKPEKFKTQIKYSIKDDTLNFKYKINCSGQFFDKYRDFWDLEIETFYEVVTSDNYLHSKWDEYHIYREQTIQEEKRVALLFSFIALIFLVVIFLVY